MKTELLEEIGLTKSEIKVYLALLELGSSTTGPIVDKAHIASSKIYEVLEKLIDKGLASYVIKAGTKHFEAANPERILDYVEEKEQNLKKQKQAVKKVLPELLLKKTLGEHKSEATIYKGIKGLHSAFYEALKDIPNKSEVYAYGVPSRSKEVNRFFIKFGKELSKRKILFKQIFTHEAKGELQTLTENNPGEIRYHPPSLSIPAAVNIFGNKVIIFPYETKSEILLISIKNKNIAESFKAQFESFWNQDTTVAKGFKAMEQVLLDFVENISSKDEYKVLGASFGVKGKEKKYAEVFSRVHKKRKEKGVKALMLFESEAKQKIKKYQKYTQQLFTSKTEIKSLPYSSSSPVAIFPYKDKTILTIQEKEPTIITINNKQVTSSFTKHFDSLWNQEARVVKGIDAVQQLFEEMIETGHVDLIGARGYFMDERREWVEKIWKPKAIKKKFTMRNLVDPETAGHYITKLPFAETRYNLPKEFSPLSVFWITNNKVAISNWVNKEPVVTVIENKEFYEVYKKQFEALWNQEIQMYKGLKGMEVAFQEALDATPKGSETYVYGAGANPKETDEILYQYNQARSKKGVRLKILFSPSAKTSKNNRDAHPETNPLAEIKFSNLPETPASYEIYPDRVIIKTATIKNPTTIVIKSKTFVETSKKNFFELWKKK